MYLPVTWLKIELWQIINQERAESQKVGTFLHIEVTGVSLIKFPQNKSLVNISLIRKILSQKEGMLFFRKDKRNCLS